MPIVNRFRSYVDIGSAIGTANIGKAILVNWNISKISYRCIINGHGLDYECLPKKTKVMLYQPFIKCKRCFINCTM